jgi:hypothetical protein
MSTSSAGLLALAERCEQATAEQTRDLLIASAEAALIADGQDADTEDAMGWLDRFEALVEAGAFLDAAITLVPEDRGPLRFFSLEHDAHDGARWIARFDSAGAERRATVHIPPSLSPGVGCELPIVAMLREAVEDAVAALKLCRVGLLHDRHAVKMIDTHLDELSYALARAKGDRA